MRWDQKVQYATLSDVGMRRQNNQDSFAVQLALELEEWKQHGHLFVVCDGMGGHAVGELASKIGVDTIPLTFFKSRAASVSAALTESVESANRAIFERGSQNRDFNRMGTTCVVLALSPQGATIAHVGDSRAYRIRRDRIEQLTFDHSLQWELQRAGRLKLGEGSVPAAKHVITRSLGPEPAVEVEVDGPHLVHPGDRFLLCSDGLTGHLNDAEIGMIVRELPPTEACRLLVNLANLRGGTDNTTVIVVETGKAVSIEGEGVEPPSDEPLPRVGPFWTMGMWLCVLLFGLGVTLIIFRRIPAGGAFTGTAILGFALLLRHWWRKKPAASSIQEDDTVQATVYRSASARTTTDFLNGLMKLAGELQKLALDEQWSVNWNAHQAAINAARDALAKKEAGRALMEISKAIDPLMPGLRNWRRKPKPSTGKGPDADPGGDTAGSD